MALSHEGHRWTATIEELGFRDGPSAGTKSEPMLDEARLTAYLGSLARQVDRPAADARLEIRPDLTIALSPSRPGLGLDVGATAARLRSAIPDALSSSSVRTESGPVEIALVVREVPPETTEADLGEARSALEKALGGPLTLKLDDRTWPLERPDLAPALSVVRGESPDGKWQVRVDDAVLAKPIEKLASQIDQPAQDARFAWSGGKLAVLRESKAGRRLDVAQTVARLKAQLFEPDRTVAVAVAPTPPTVGTQQKDQLGIRELIGSARTSFVGAIAEKQHNIRLAASRLNGVVVPPGATFSFNKEVGPTTLAAGFQWGFGIVSGNGGLKTIPSVAGGICQVSTTLFQAVFWAGYQVEERNWHLYWIPAYTSKGIVGLDSTVDEESGLDFKFTNTTSNHLLIQAGVEGNEVWFSLYGTKPTWRVEVDKPVITNVTPADPQLVVEEDPTRPWGYRLQVEAAREGFDVAIVRRVHESGHVGNVDGGPGALRTLRLKSIYKPSRNVVLVGTKGKPAGAPAAATPSPAPIGSATPAGTSSPGMASTPGPAVTPTRSGGSNPQAPTPTLKASPATRAQP